MLFRAERGIRVLACRRAIGSAGKTEIPRVARDDQQEHHLRAATIGALAVSVPVGIVATFP
jgi:hypothetical protein